MRVVMPIARTCAVVRFASWVVTTTRALRPVGESTAASRFRRVAGTSITRPGRDGTTKTRPPSSTRKGAARGGGPHPFSRPAEAAEGTEPVAVPLRKLHRGGPVGLDAEIPGTQAPAVAPDGEDDRHVRDRSRARLELRRGLPRSQAADVDAGHGDAVGDPSRRARKGKAQTKAGDDRHSRQGKQALDQKPPCPGAPPRSRPPCRRSGS